MRSSRRVAQQPAAPVPPRRSFEPFKITAELVSKALNWRQPNRAAREQIAAKELAEKLLKPYPPRPGVVPDNEPQLAMDDAEFSAVASWAATGYGYALDEGMAFLGYPYLSQLWQRPEYRRITETIAGEMTREWIKIKGIGTDNKNKEAKIKKLDEAQKKFHLKETIKAVLEYDGGFGRGQLFIDLANAKGESYRDNPAELKSSIEANGEVAKEKVPKGSLLGFKAVEPIWSYPNNYDSTDPLSPKWYKPETWFVMGKEVHHTRLLTCIMRPVADIFKPAYSFGGLSLTQMALPYVENWLRTRQSVSDLVHSFSTNVLHTNLGSTMGTDGNDLFRRVDFYLALRDNRNCMVIDKETEDLSNVSTPISGLSELQAQSQEHICSVSGLPLVKYTGLTPTGLNASSEGELRSFYDWIKSLQELIRWIVKRCLDVIQLSEFGSIDPEIDFDFVGLWQLDEAGKMAVQQIKAEIHETYNGLGVVDAGEIRKAVANDPDSPYAGLDLDPDELPEPPAPPMGGGAEPGGGAAGGEGRTVGRESISAGGGGRAGAASGV